MQTPIVEFKSVSTRFKQFEILKEISFQMMPGKVHALIGASGSGKTTILRLMNGLIRPTSGVVLVDGAPLDYDTIVKLRRTMGYVIQESGLFPHMTVLENISLVSKRAGISASEIRERAERLMTMVNLPPQIYFEKRPHQLSGGEKQRIGIVRSLMLNPKLLLMDEPFGALDPITRRKIQNEFLSLIDQLKLTVVLVTHDLREAFKLSHHLILLHDKQIAQQGTPNEFLLHPQSKYVNEVIDALS